MTKADPSSDHTGVLSLHRISVEQDGGVSSIESVYRQIADVVRVIDSARAARVRVERHDHVLLAMAAVSRCRSLLLGAAELHRVGRIDIVGVLVRALVEVWYFGVISLFGDQSDIDRLVQDHRYWKNDLVKQFPGVRPEQGVGSKFSVYERAKRADELLRQIGQQPGVALDYYRIFYAGESLTNAHAGLESLSTYVFEDEDGDIGILREPDDDGLGYGRLRAAVVLTLLLARWTWKESGLDLEPFDEIKGFEGPSSEPPH